jgi:hypothetical protein
MQTVGMTRIIGQHTAVALLRLGQPAVLMQTQGLEKQRRRT